VEMNEVHRVPCLSEHGVSPSVKESSSSAAPTTRQAAPIL